MTGLSMKEFTGLIQAQEAKKEYYTDTQLIQMLEVRGYKVTRHTPGLQDPRYDPRGFYR